jgi:hypothetical protein
MQAFHAFISALPTLWGLRAAVVALTLALAGCGGGGAAPEPAPPPPAPKAWAGAAAVELGALDADDPQIAVDAKGNAMAVWVQQQPGSFRRDIWAARYVAGTGWGQPELIETGTGSAFSPQVAVDASGNAIAVWEQAVGAGEEDVRANRYVAGSGWGQAQLVSNLAEVGEANDVQIAMDASGNALVVWRQSEGEGVRQNLWFNRYAVSSGWGVPDLVERSPGDTFAPQIAMNASGIAMAVWRQSEDGSDLVNVMASRYEPGSGWAVPELVELNNSGDAFDPQIALHANGNAIAVWNQFDGTRHNIWASRFTPAGQWSAPELIEFDDLDRAFDPQISMDASGNAIAVWEQSDGVRLNIWASRFDGTRWDTAQKIETDDTDDARGPQVAMDASGNALAVWEQSDGTSDSIWAARYVAGAGWRAPELLETSDTDDTEEPQIAMNANGNAIAVWRQSAGAVGSIFANVFK